MKGMTKADTTHATNATLMEATESVEYGPKKHFALNYSTLKINYGD